MTGQRKALIVASDEYEHEGLGHLPGPAADAEALGRVLGDPQIGNFAVQLVYNEPSAAIQEKIEDFLSEGGLEDDLLLHFSCHGLKSESGELFLAARNTRPNRLSSTAIAAHFVDQCMRTSRSRRIVLLLDCCYGGAFSPGVTVRATGNVNVLDAFAGGKLGGGRGRAVITASSAMEYAFEGTRLAEDHSPTPSVFTKALVDGLATGDADRDEDGWVALNELYDYVFDKVREQNPHQTPGRNVEMQGELYVARSRRRRIVAAPLPPDLDAARKDHSMFARRGAVSELRSRLLSEDLAVALGAWEALAELANDNELVANDARAAMREAEVHPSETELRFGPLAQGSPPPRRTVRLLGPPIARACRPEASHRWIHVEETAEGFERTGARCPPPAGHSLPQAAIPACREPAACPSCVSSYSITAAPASQPPHRGPGARNAERTLSRPSPTCPRAAGTGRPPAKTAMRVTAPCRIVSDHFGKKNQPAPARQGRARAPGPVPLPADRRGPRKYQIDRTVLVHARPHPDLPGHGRPAGRHHPPGLRHRARPSRRLQKVIVTMRLRIPRAPAPSLARAEKSSQPVFFRTRGASEAAVTAGKAGDHHDSPGTRHHHRHHGPPGAPRRCRDGPAQPARHRRAPAVRRALRVPV